MTDVAVTDPDVAAAPAEPVAPEEPTGAAEIRPGRREQAALDLVEEWGRGSFPASDPPANW